MRATVRHLGEYLLTASGAPSLAARWRPGTLVLAYHNIVPDGAAPEGDRSLHLPLSRFRAQLERLRRTHDVVGLADLLAPPATRRPRFAVTFDDAYHGALALGVPAAQALDIPVTIFVAPGLLGLAATWWDLLADPATGLSDTVRRHALGPLRGEHARVLAWAEATGVPLHSPSERVRIASADEVRSVATQPGVRLGLHTWSHPNLAELDEAETSAELGRCRHWLLEQVGQVEPWLAYPYGLHTAATLEAARAAGLSLALRVEGGVLRGNPLDSPYRIPRLNVPAGMSERGLALRAAGLLGS